MSFDSIDDTEGGADQSEQKNAGDFQPARSKVINLAVYKIKKSLRDEGFDLLTDTDGKLTLALRLSRDP